ncbi:MAG: oligoendopeptidase F, partial [Pirellulales bacterium]|nr:oligoendopeptidase F [Pirellulales bacterium]
MSKVKQLPPRNKVKKSDCWDLSTLFVDDDAWEAAFKKWEKRISQYAGFQGRLGNDAKTLADCFKFDLEFDRESERLGTYAFLKVAEDTSNSTYQRMQGRYVNVASKASQAGAYIRPEILAIPKAKITKFLADHNMKPYRLIVERLLRQKPHTLGKNEEKLLAMQTEMSQAAGQIFGQLNNADLKFGTVKDETGQLLELSHATFSKMMHCPKRNVRKAAFDKYYQEFDDHKNTLAATLNGSIQCDIYYAKARNHAGSLQAALFPDRVPVGVYDNLIKTVRDGLPALYRYYDVRRRKMRLRDIHHYDTYVPILSDLQVSRTWNQAVELVMKALQPLGDGYCGILKEGLQGRWCDRYENRGKRSGAFSCGSYDADPF